MQHSQNRWLWKIDYYRQRLQHINKMSLAERLANCRQVAENRVLAASGRRPARTDWQERYWPKNFTPPRFRAPIGSSSGRNSSSTTSMIRRWGGAVDLRVESRSTRLTFITGRFCGSRTSGNSELNWQSAYHESAGAFSSQSSRSNLSRLHSPARFSSSGKIHEVRQTPNLEKRRVNLVRSGLECCGRIFISLYILHRLGDDAFGLWILIFSVTGYYGLFDLGIRSSIIRYVAKFSATDDHAELNRLVNRLCSAIAPSEFQP